MPGESVRKEQTTWLRLASSLVGLRLGYRRTADPSASLGMTKCGVALRCSAVADAALAGMTMPGWLVGGCSAMRMGGEVPDTSGHELLDGLNRLNTAPGSGGCAIQCRRSAGEVELSFQ